MDTVEVYMAEDGRRWRRLAANGMNIGHGGQGYSRTIDLMKVVSRTLKPPYLLRNLISGQDVAVVDEKTAELILEEELVQAGEVDELDMPEPGPDTKPVLDSEGACFTFDVVGDNLAACANCRRPFWTHTHRATTYGNQRITDQEKVAAREMAEKEGLL